MSLHQIHLVLYYFEEVKGKYKVRKIIGVGCKQNLYPSFISKIWGKIYAFLLSKDTDLLFVFVLEERTASHYVQAPTFNLAKHLANNTNLRFSLSLGRLVLGKIRFGKL